MGDSSFPDVRIGDVERADAQRLLNEHLTAGRLTPEEYGDRATQAAGARTQGDLLRLFTDLPAPHPAFGMPRSADAYTPPPPPVAYEPRIEHPPAKRGPSTWMIAAITVPIIVLGVVVTILGTFGSTSFLIGLVVVGVVLLLLFGGG
ncbi:DUF1707 domain-containing protein [Allokutzneria sp. A3M-2-11 16]|uniref:DUF1707 SHOCT-like domain-containing protein n=1 Tax=Allokutzneria sp. A3M-2-11 16 TaxID=2962043 RepID=UPI0020B6AB5D|nr:DUF1707 domain-containing protein [Allokutzneria sp. A3M-2-11 16]MCP3800438.1 DUF1707 domain-containing protein [Allokutzneria sp. A3M-2-11 16]